MAKIVAVLVFGRACRGERELIMVARLLGFAGAVFGRKSGHSVIVEYGDKSEALLHGGIGDWRRWSRKGREALYTSWG